MAEQAQEGSGVPTPERGNPEQDIQLGSEHFIGDIVGKDKDALEPPKGMSRRQWLAAATTLAGVGAVATFKGGEIWEWIQAEVLEVPAAVRAQYRDPNMTKDVIIPREGRYPYSESTMEVYAEEERRMFPDRDGTEVALIIATNIANRVAEQAREVVQTKADQDHPTGKADEVTHKEALNLLASSPEGMNEYMKLIARELIRSGCYYKIEGSLDSAVDEERHNSSKFHLDCDLLCHLALHCASRHDMPLHGMRAPQHMYIGSPAYGAFAIEMTAFRGERVRRQDGLRNEVMTTIGEGYFTSQGAMQMHFSRTVPRSEVERLGYYTPLDLNAMREGAVGNLLVELLTEGLQKKDPAQLEYICAVGDRELNRFVGKDLVAQNVYAVHSLARDYYIKTWRESEGQSDRESQHRALFHARRIARLKETHGQYISRGGDRRDQQILNDLEKSVLPPEPEPTPAPEPAPGPGPAPAPEPAPEPAPGPVPEPLPAPEPPGGNVPEPPPIEGTGSRRDFFNLFRGLRG